MMVNEEMRKNRVQQRNARDLTFFSSLSTNEKNHQLKNIKISQP